MNFSPLIKELIDALRCLPGIGPKSAQRMAVHLLSRNRDKGNHLAQCLQQAMANIGHCQICNILCEADFCQLCTDTRRNKQLLCVVGSMEDAIAIEQSSNYRGRYFVLMGHLSPLDGIGPSDIGLDKLVRQLQQGDINEVILATNSTVEGETTAHYVTEIVKQRGLKISRIARGIPMGSELAFLDVNTISHALTDRELL